MNSFVILQTAALIARDQQEYAAGGKEWEGDCINQNIIFESRTNSVLKIPLFQRNIPRSKS